MPMIFLRDSRIFLLLTVLLLACHTPPKQPPEGLENFEHRYYISYSEENSTVEGGAYFVKDEKKIALPEAYSIYFDDTPLSVENADELVYTMKKQVVNPYGIHTTTIMLDDRPAYQVQLSLAPFRLRDTLTFAKIGRKNLSLRFEGVKDGDEILCRFEDSLYLTVGFFPYTVMNNSVTIPATEIRQMKKTTLSFHAELRTEQPVYFGSKEIGSASAYLQTKPIPVIIDY